MYLEQVALLVADYDEAIDFFTRALGFDLVHDEAALTNDGRIEALGRGSSARRDDRRA
jgi:catechol 2,3-dioxygenase-like lactoylglutathione lyase family enzyme